MIRSCGRQSKALERSVRKATKIFPFSTDFFPFLNHGYQAILCTETLPKATLKFWKDISKKFDICLLLSWRRPLSYRNQSTDLRSKSMGWFLYDNGLRHERVKKAPFVNFWNIWQDTYRPVIFLWIIWAFLIYRCDIC